MATVESLPTMNELQQLLDRLHETRKLNRELSKTVAKNDIVIQQLKSLITAGNGRPRHSQDNPGPLAFLAHSSAAAKLGLSSSLDQPLSDEKSSSLSTNVSFALSQLPALQSLLRELRPTLNELNKSADSPAVEPDVAKERRRYVETQSRRALERQGISTGTDTAEALGRIATSDELTSLEALVDGSDD
jgi:kinetochore protein Mis12/MTW1